MQPTNTLDPITPTVDGFDPFDSASNPELPAFALWGVVEVSAWACALVKGTGKVPYDANNPNHKRTTAIDIFIAPIADQNINNPKSCERHMIAESKEWANITWKSIKDLGVTNLREVNGKWARVAVVPSGKTYKNKDGETKDETTFKFVAFYASEAELRAAYVANGGKVSEPTFSTPVISQDDADRQTAAAFLAVIVPNAVKGKTTPDEKKLAVATALTQYPTVSRFFSAESAEVMALMGA